jgi:16S rRNA (guanine966-N2)-methyltransferase
VLDIYAGTGSLGIEALSRGAQWADFVERDPRCCAALKENLQNAGLASQAHVYCCSITKAVSFLKRRYGIVLMGPPYADSSVIETLEQLAVSSLVGPGTTIVVEHSFRLPLSPVYGNFHLINHRRHGDTCISIYN